jgi:hypothetical protein
MFRTSMYNKANLYLYPHTMFHIHGSNDHYGQWLPLSSWKTKIWHTYHAVAFFLFSKLNYLNKYCK